MSAILHTPAASGTTIMARDGDSLDAVLDRAGLGPESLPAALALNPALTAVVVLPAGTLVAIPASPVITGAVTRPIIQLWS